MQRSAGQLINYLMLASLTLCLHVPGTAHQGKARSAGFAVRDECTFSDGAKILFGRKALEKTTGRVVWKTGNYAATAFRVTARTIIPPLDSRIELAPGLYTVFVDASSGEPWTLIVSKKTPQSGMPYPGESYDVGRISMGFDDSPRAPVAGFAIGCTHWGQKKENPMFIWIESGTHVCENCNHEYRFLAGRATSR